MRIAILGAGAVGGCLAAGLAEGGNRVSLLVRGDHLEAIRTNGLRLIRPDGAQVVFDLHATDDPSRLGAQDLIVSTLKSPALAGVLAALPRALLKGPPLITAMNGVFWWYGHRFSPGGHTPDTARLDPDGTLAGLVDPDNVIGAIIYSTKQVIAPGVVQNRSTGNRFVLGSPDPARTAWIAQLVSPLSGSLVTLEVTPDIRRQMWHKLVRNLSSAPLSVLTAARVREIYGDPDVAPLARALFLEGAAVARAHGIDGLAEDVDQAVRFGAGALQQPSMRQDLELRRPLEIDTMLAVVHDFARQSGVPAPVLETVLALVRLRAQVAGCYPAPAGFDGVLG